MESSLIWFMMIFIVVESNALGSGAKPRLIIHVMSLGQFRLSWKFFGHTFEHHDMARLLELSCARAILPGLCDLAGQRHL